MLVRLTGVQLTGVQLTGVLVRLTEVLTVNRWADRPPH